MHVVIYARKSTESEDRQALSIDSQVTELRQFAKREQLSIDAVLTESRSAKTPGRPVFAELMKTIQKGQVEAVLCWKLDRLARNPIDGAALIWAMEEKKLTRLITPHGSFGNTGNDKFWVQMELGMAKKYVDDLSDNTKRGLRAKAQQGWKPGPPMLGYKNDVAAKTIVPDPERFPLVRRMWDLMLTGAYTIPAVRNIAAEEWGLRSRDTKRGGKPISRSQVYEIFTSPFYYGLLRYAGDTFIGAHSRMVTKEEYDKVQAFLLSRSRQRPKRHTFAYTGLMRCGECGAGITAEHKTNRYGTTYVYYHCTKRKPGVRCGQGVVQEQDLERQLCDFLRSISISPAIAEHVLRALDGNTAEEMRLHEQVRTNLKAQLAACERQINSLLDLKLRSLLSDKEYVDKRASLQEDKIALELQLERSGSKRVLGLAESRNIFQLSSACVAAFQNGTVEEKREILKCTGSNFVLQDKLLRIQAHKPFSIIQSHVSRQPVLDATFEPEMLRLGKPTNPQVNGGLLAGLRMADDVRTFFRNELLKKTES